MKGQGLQIGPVKSRHSNRDIPIPVSVADQLRALHVAPDELVFCSSEGTVYDANNLTNRVLAPAMAEANVTGGWHTFRHTVATRLSLPVATWSGPALAGHDAASFMLDCYVHLLSDGDVGLAMPLASNPNTFGISAVNEWHDAEPESIDTPVLRVAAF